MLLENSAGIQNVKYLLYIKIVLIILSIRFKNSHSLNVFDITAKKRCFLKAALRLLFIAAVTIRVQPFCVRTPYKCTYDRSDSIVQHIVKFKKTAGSYQLSYLDNE